jgi:hypothetical protein
LLDIVLNDVGVSGDSQADWPVAGLPSHAIDPEKSVLGGAVPLAVRLVAECDSFTGGVVGELVLAELNGHVGTLSPGVCFRLFTIVLNGLKKWTFGK